MGTFAPSEAPTTSKPTFAPSDAPTTYQGPTYEDFGTSQCFTSYPQYPEDRADNPIFGGGGFDMVGTASACQTQCNDPNTIDSRGRRCVAVEHSSQDPNAVANCAFAWDCSEIRHWAGGKVYRRTTEAPNPHASRSPSTTEPTMGPTRAP